MNSKIVILGDLHLGKGLSLSKGGASVGASIVDNSRLIDQINLMDWTLERAIETHADRIFLTGDVFEEPKPHPAIIAAFMSWIKRCQACDIKLEIIMGNHDMLRSGFSYVSPLDIITEAELEGITVHKSITSIIDEYTGTSFTLMPFRDRKSLGANTNELGLSIIQGQLDYELASIPQTYTKIIIGHLAIEGSIFVGDEIDDLTNELFCPINMFGGFDYVWMGHVHKPQMLNHSNPYVAHTGSMDISNFGETDHKKHIVIFDCGTKTWLPETLPTRALQKISISVPKDTLDTTAYVLDAIQEAKIIDQAIVRLDISLVSPELQSISKKTVEEYLTKQGAFSISSISETRKVNIIKKSDTTTGKDMDTKMDVATAIKNYADSYIAPEERSNFIQLGMEIFQEGKID